ncbi:MAG: pilus assembly protein [Chloroflexi bacterium]|nr:pilus assembly protein [Chloroflexota bacterium]MCI0576201.1 pilus assembly protein [Chloroflexota bacterium]MCI0645505.1 pilus assembly protein [Chloroflexota bacterium]MCI0730644.1 pilus assembly protein [Chloroflexota bacterium]
MFQKKKILAHGQAMVEFALILVVLLFFIFIIIESGRLFQGWLTVQNAARAGGRYAITGAFEEECLTQFPPCLDARVESIKDVARESSAGLDIDPNAAFGEPGYHLVQVQGQAEKDGPLLPDYAGGPGLAVEVRVQFEMPVITPLLRPIADSVRLTGHVLLNNEDFLQVTSTQTDNDPPATGGGGGGGGGGGPSYADLSLTKTASSSVVVVGGSFNYTINVQNSGPFDAEFVVVSDTLPSGVNGVTYVNSTVSPLGSCSLSGSVLTCQLPNLNGGGAGSSASVTINVTAPLVTGPITNTATVGAGGSTTDPNLGNNTDSVVVTIINPNQADLELVSKQDSPDPVTISNPLVYTILVKNNGVVAATGATVVDTLPGGLSGVSGTWTSPSGSGSCSVSGVTVTCNIGNMAVNDTATVTISATAPGAPQSISNTATVSNSGPQGDPVPTNNSKTETTIVAPPESDLYVQKSDSPDPLPVGQQLNYVLTVGNNGPAAATGVTVVDTLPASVTYVSATPTQGSCSQAAGVVTCNLGTVPPLSPATVTIVVTPNQVGTISNQAVVSNSGGQTDPVVANNTAVATTSIQTTANLSITKADSADPIFAGGALAYTLVVNNAGPTQANSVQVTDTLPPTVNFAGYSTTQGSCSLSSGIVTCQLGTLANGASATITLNVIPTAQGSIFNQASVTSSTFDPNTANNSDSETTTVTPATNAFITLTPSCGPAGYTVTVNGYNWPTSGNKDIDIRWNSTTGTILATITNNPATWSTTITIPSPVANGTYTVYAVRQNPGPTVSATFQVPCPSPNIWVTAPVVLNPPAQAGLPTTIQVFVTNDGQVAVAGQFFVGLYVNPDPAPQVGTSTTIADTSSLVKLVGLTDLAVGQTKLVLFTLPGGLGPAGTHDVYAWADTGTPPGTAPGNVSELNETDNIDVTQVTVVPPLTPQPTPSASATPTIGLTPTPSLTPTGGPSPTPTATPMPGGFVGQTFVTSASGGSLPQANVWVTLSSETDPGYPDQFTFSDSNGEYFFAGIPPGTYTITGCITIENEDYFYSVSGQVLPAGTVIQLNLFLTQDVCS